VLGVALFCSLIGQKDAFLFGARMALIISGVLRVAAAAIALGGRIRRSCTRGHITRSVSDGEMPRLW
jgi:hypothetical protein